MAVLTINSQSAKMPVGLYWMQTFNTSSTGDSKTDEYIPTGLGTIIAVVGNALIQAAPGSSTCNFVKNVRGTAGTPGDYPGDLGIETLTGAAATLEVTVIGT